MATHKLLGPLAALLVAACAHPIAAHAQFGVNLPRNDFTWMWGDSQDTTRRRVSDFSVTGGEAGFSCNLIGKLRISSRWSRSDIRQLESDLRASMFFVQSAANTMNVLDRRRELEWATLDCTKPAQTEADEEREQQRLDRARERMIEEQRRRRERQQQ
jgi:hypothetical protein